MQLKYSILFSSSIGLELMGVQVRPVSDAPRGRSFEELSDFAAEMFNNDPDISKVYSAESWTAEFMEYGCYCNKFVRGGGVVDTDDMHENLCLELYACYKCISVDYATGDRSGPYASTGISYNANINSDNEFVCKNKLEDPKNSKDTESGDFTPEANMERHVCECDKNFVQKILDNHKKCLGGNSSHCLTDRYRFSQGWVADDDCKDVGMKQGADHSACCGTYPDRRAYDPDNLLCCDGKLTGNTMC